MVAHLGDYINGSSESTKDGSREEYKTYRKAMYESGVGVPAVWLKGNHDANVQGGDEFTDDEMFGLIGANNQGEHVTEYGNENKLYGYLEFPAKKLRVIYLNSSDGWKTGVSGEQAAWLSDTGFDLSDKSDMTEWGIVMLIHIPVTFSENAAILAAINTFTAKTERPELIAIFHGHCHNFRTEQVGDARVWQIGIPELCVGRSNEYGTAGQEDIYGSIFGEFDSEGNPVYYLKTSDTAEDTSFNVVTIDRGSKLIHCHVFGAGYDRTISYKDALVPYTVTNILTNASTSNKAVTVYGGMAYSAVLTPDEGYDLETVTVTMGGADVTGEVYSDGAVSIAGVTGDVVITATAAQQAAAAYTNLFNPDDPDFADAVRFSSSGGTSSGSGFCSGYIAARPGDVIRVRNPGGGYTESVTEIGWQLRCLCTYDSGKALISALYPVDVTVDADGLGFTYTITDESAALVRVSGNPNGNYSGFIVTVNEEITE